MNNIISNLKIKFGILPAIGLIFVSAMFLGLAPREIHVAKSENCANAPTQATLNYFPYTYESVSGIGCTDFAPLVIRNLSRGESYPTSLQDHADGVTASAGDELLVRMYIHNGAQQGLDPQVTTARNVRADITVDGNAEPEHVIGGTISSSNTNTVAGSMSVHTGANERLEVVPGSGQIYDYQANAISSAPVGGTAFSVSLGDMEACFEFSKFIVFKVRVVAETPPVSTVGSGQISASLGGQVIGECLYTGHVNWSTTSVNEAMVTVSDPDLNSNSYYGNDKVFSWSTASSQTVPWIEPGRPYRFTLWQVNPGSEGQQMTFQGGQSFNVKHLDEAWVTGGGTLSCGPETPPSVNKTHSLNAYFTSPINGQCLYNGSVTWSSEGYSAVLVTVDDLDDSTGEIQHSQELYGNNQTPWLTPNHRYVYKLYDISNGYEYRVELAQKGFTVPNLECGGTPPPPVNPPATPINFEISASRFCVGEAPQYIVTADKALAGKKILWTSKFNGQLTSEIDADYGFYLGLNNNRAEWAQFGNAWNSSHIGNWEKIANIDGVKKSVTFTVRDCSTPTPPPVVKICPSNVSLSLSKNSINVGESVSVNVPAGWYGGNIVSSNANVASVSGLTVRGNSQGSATISGNGFTAPNGATNCGLNGVTIHVTQPVTPPLTLVCSPSNQTVNVNQYAYFSVSGGEGTINWSAPSGSPSAGVSSPTFSTFYTTGGNKTVTATRGSQSASCNVKVEVPTPPPVCVPNQNAVLTNSNITLVSGNTYRTTISYSFSGNNHVKLTYVDPVDSQEKVFVQSASVGGSKVFENLLANSSYVFKMYDTSSCGGVIATLVVRKDVGQQVCVPNTNPNLNLSTPVKNGNTYSVVVSWTSGGTHKIKIGHNSTSNVIVTGNASGSHTVTGLQPGSSHTFYMSDEDCGTLLDVAAISLPYEPINPPSGGNTYNNCVNNSCNVNITTTTTNTNTNNYYYNYQNNQEFRQLSIVKEVRAVNGGSFQNSATVNNNDLVEYRITVRNSGNATINNIKLTDPLPSGVYYTSGSFNANEIYVGSLNVGESRSYSFQARVTGSSNQGIQNIATAYGDSVSQVQDDAWVFVNGNVAGGNVSLTYSKKAFNETKNQDATAVFASREDYIVYTLTVVNNGNTPANGFVITDDLSQVLPYADIVENGGGTVNGQVITFPSINIPSNGSVSKSFKVRVKYHLASNLSYTMNNTYGNTVVVRINQPQVLGEFIAPKTGADTAAFGFASMLTLAFAAYKKRKALMSLTANII